MTLHIKESEVRQILTMAMAIEAVETVSRKQAEGQVVVHARRRFELPAGYFHYMAAFDKQAGFLAMKQYTYVNKKLRFLVPLYSTATGELLAMIEADFLGQQRTGAASGVATKYLARTSAKVAGIIGSGGQAKTQLEAIAGVRKLQRAFVYGRDPKRRDEFAEVMSQRLGFPVQAADSAAECVAQADIVSTATTSTQPVLLGQDVHPGMHINAIGANHASKRELDEAAVDKADPIFVDFLEQARQEAGDLIIPFSKHPERWNGVHELAELVAGKTPGRSLDSQITLFKSNGIAAWDLAVAMLVYPIAEERGLGEEISLDSSLP
jgi:alanine dehydrogenase